MAFIPNFKIK